MAGFLSPESHLKAIQEEILSAEANSNEVDMMENTVVTSVESVQDET